MHPAPSIVLFTTASGAGYGLLVWASLLAVTGLVPATTASGLAFLLPGLGLVTLGLLASTLHLGHPERAWRAVSQWRSSWLSREGVAALLTYLPALLLAWQWVMAGRVGALPALATAALALVTVYCTAMIYASLKPIPRWHHPLVPAIYLAFSLASGAALALALAAWVVPSLAGPAVLLVAVLVAGAWWLKWQYWQSIDKGPRTATTADAIGLPGRGTARLLEAPHTERNYILNEMGFKIARKHKAKLRRLALLAGAAGPLALILLALIAGPAAPLLLTLAALGMLLGVLVERWLFFAEAEHLVMLYYGSDAV